MRAGAGLAALEGCERMSKSCANCKHGNNPGNAYPCKDCLPTEIPSMWEPEPENSLDNPYWKAIEALAERQREKGISKYGQGLESNPMDIIERLTYLEEELVDGLFYIEHIKAFLREKGVLYDA